MIAKGIFCQKPRKPSSPQILSSHDPPPYTPSASAHTPTSSVSEDEPPAYDSSEQPPREAKPQSSSSKPHFEDVLHFVHPDQDSVRSLSLRYGVPPDALRQRNNLYSDHLLAARRTVLIPGEFYQGGVSLSPQPVDGEEEELRKAKVRRWMVACKVVEYDMALIYLEQAGYDLDAAVDAYYADEKWEADNPLRTRIRNGKTAAGRGPKLTAHGRSR
ncbi:MAG: hypothetical protein M1825_000228 [Sarcosagium campestre]|nr:MAG: hypothetical protein M1825_000228 [Sarcosagium campestre]